MDEVLHLQDRGSFEGRIAARLGVRFIVEVGEISRGGAPFLEALLRAAIIDANVGQLNRDPGLQLAYAAADAPPPDEMRRPVSINALSLSLKQPFETVRRHINNLAAQGVCVVTPAGVYVPSRVLATPAWLQAARARYTLFWTLYDELREFGMVDPVPYRAPPAEHPDAPIRAVGRILSDYYFRTTDAMRANIRDTLTGTLLLRIVLASTEHLSRAEIAAILRRGWADDAERRAISVAEVARRTGIPYETARRHTAWLVEQGYCTRRDDGLTIDSGVFGRPGLAAFSIENLGNIRRMFRHAAAVRAPAVLDAEA